MEFVYITGWPRGRGRGGINIYKFDKSSASLEYISSVNEDVAFGTAFINMEKNILYALNEVKSENGGYIYSYKIDCETGALDLIGKTSSLSQNPAYLGLDPQGKYAVVADHSFYDFAVTIEQNDEGKYIQVLHVNDAVVVLFEVNEDGSIGEAADVVKHEGNGPGSRQEMPHPHCTVFSPDGKILAVCDKGNDHVYIYSIDEEKGKLKEVTRWKKDGGYKPRYAAFHPCKPFFYHNNEGNGLVSAYTYDEKYCFTNIGEFLSVPKDQSGHSLEQQGLCIDAQGRFLYDAVKGPECISVFEINQDNGKLKLIQNIKKDYSWLRSIEISPDGNYLIATYIEGEKVAVFKINEDGTLSDTGSVYDCSRAAGIAFI